MSLRLFLMFIALLSATALADEPMMPPSVWETCSPSGEYCARLDPVENSILAYKPGVETIVLWRATGWSRVAALADDGEHMVLGYEGMNLIPLDYRPDMPMLTFYRRGEVFRTVRLEELISYIAIKMNRTASHYHWGDYLGLDENGHFGVRTATGHEMRFDMATGRSVR